MLMWKRTLVKSEMIDRLDLLDSFLEFEEWVMDQVEAAQDAQDDDESSSDEERDSKNDNKNWIFGLAPMNINL